MSLFNAPGLPALAYRIGTHSSFLARMLARLPHERIAGGPNAGTRPLAALTTRAPDDPAIALLDAAALVADVVTFYQERIANEGFLRTATERRSVLELAREIGYELAPGVAAAAWVAFTVEDAAGAPGVATIAAGTRVQSLPAQGKLPQTFETSEAIEARAEWNALRPRLTQPQQLAIDGGALEVVAADGTKSPATQLYLDGTAAALRAGDLLLAALRPDAASPIAVAVARVRAAVADSARQQTVVSLADVRMLPSFRPGLLAALAPSLVGGLELTTANVSSHVLSQTLSERELDALLVMSRWRPRDVLAVASAPVEVDEPPEEGVFAFRSSAGFFGHNAPRWKSLAAAQQADPYPSDWDASGGRTIWTDSQGHAFGGVDAFLERSLPEVLPGSWALLVEGGEHHAYRVAGVADSSLADYALSGKATGLRLQDATGADLPAVSSRPALGVRTTTAYVQSERLEPTGLPIPDPLLAGDSQLELDTMVLGLAPGRAVALAGELADAHGAIGREVLVLADVLHSEGRTRLRFATALQRSYVRDTVTLNANVAHATHGESVAEPLGSGDGRVANQEFALKKPPLTYVSAATATGSASTLAVRVDGVLWQEVESLYGRGPKEQVFVTRTADDGTTTIVFGDGASGARLSSGANNVEAAYRSGSGPDGNLDEDSLTLLQTRPLGVRASTNPLRASGGAPAETLATAREHAPLRVLTLDRIVSLQDFEDFASAFAGIGKARAVALWDGQARVVHVTVAGDGGAAVDPSSDTFRSLVVAIDRARDPIQQVLVASYAPVPFELSAGLVVDARYERAAVEAAVASVLGDLFAFERRGFGQAVTAAETIAGAQRVPGVVAVELHRLALVGAPAQASPPPPFLAAASARWEGGAIAPAQLLQLGAAGVTLTQGAP